MEIPSLPECNNVLIVAPVSSGKSWLMQRWINSMERSLMIDVTAESTEPSFTHVWANPKQLYQLLRQNPFYYRIAYHPSSRAFFQDFDWCVKLLWLSETPDKKPLPRWLLVDEIHEVCSSSSITESMDLIIRYARHVLIGFIGATQKFSDTNALMRDNARMMVFFQNTDGIECDAIRKKFGKEVELQVRNLRPLILDEVTKQPIQEPQCLVWLRGQGVKVYDLGDKLKSSVATPQQEEKTEWREKNSQEPQSEEVVLSLEQTSGTKESQ